MRGKRAYRHSDIATQVAAVAASCSGEATHHDAGCHKLLLAQAMWTQNFPATGI